MEISFDIDSVLNILKLFLGITFGLLIIIIDLKKKNNALFLGLFILVTGLQSIPEILIGIPYFSKHTYVHNITTLFLWLRIPLLYIYVQRVSILPKKRIAYWLLIPGLLEIILYFVLFFFDEKYQLYFEDSIGYVIYILSGVLFIIIVAIKTFKHTRRHLKELQNQYSSIEYRKLKWVKNYILFFLLTIFIIMPTVIAVSVSSTSTEAEPDEIIGIAGAIVGLIFIYWAAVKGLLQDSVPSLYQNRVTIENKNNTIIQKKDENFNDKEASTVIISLKDIVKKNELYKKNDLTIIDVAEELNIHPSKLSKIINTRLNQNFNNFINEYRIEYSKLLLQENFEKMSIEGISLESGFKSRSSFYVAFKKHAKVTPSEYIKSLLG